MAKAAVRASEKSLAGSNAAPSLTVTTAGVALVVVDTFALPVVEVVLIVAFAMLLIEIVLVADAGAGAGGVGGAAGVGDGGGAADGCGTGRTVVSAAGTA